MLIMPEQKQLLDEELIRLYLDKGEERYFRELVERYVPRMHAYVCTHFGSGPELDDIMQEIFVGVFRSLPAFRFEASFKTWLYSIAYRQVKHFRKQASSNKQQHYAGVTDSGYDVLSNIEDQSGDVPSSLIAREEKEAVRHALSRLPEKQKVIISFCYCLIIHLY